LACPLGFTKSFYKGDGRNGDSAMAKSRIYYRISYGPRNLK